MSNYMSIFWGTIFFITSLVGLNNYFNDDERHIRQEKINDLEQLVKQGVKAVALRDPEYTETTVKIARIPVTSYSGTYRFMVGTVQYANGYKQNEEPKHSVMEIYYLKSNPNVNSPTPNADLESLKDAQSSRFGLYVGLFFLFVSSGSIWMGIKNIRDKKRREEEAELIEMARFREMKEAELEEKKRKGQARLENSSSTN